MRLLRLKEGHESTGRFKGDRHIPRGSPEARGVRGEYTTGDDKGVAFEGESRSSLVSSCKMEALLL